MTRINCVPPSELTDQHLFAEARELPRIISYLKKSKFKLANIPPEYKLNEGHLKFFYNKLLYCKLRYIGLTEQLIQRNLKIPGGNRKDEFDELAQLIGYPESLEYFNNWKPTTKAQVINRYRIYQRISANPDHYTYYGDKIDWP